MLYCICRKPYYQHEERAMIACDNCDEWYHFDCVKLIKAPEVYTCPACNLQTEEDLPMLVKPERQVVTLACEYP